MTPASDAGSVPFVERRFVPRPNPGERGEETVGERIRRLRRRAGLTQQNLADQCDVSRRTVSGWECDRVYPRRRHMEALASTLAVDILQIEEGDTVKTVLQRVADEIVRRLGHGLPMEELPAQEDGEGAA